MARPRKDSDERLLLSAKREFFANGYENASVRKIAKGAGTSPAAIYVRYSDKQGLYAALVESPASGLKRLLCDRLETVYISTTEYPENFYAEHYQQNIPLLMNYIYSHFDVFRLLAVYGGNGVFRRFCYELALIELEYSKRIAAKVSGMRLLTDETLCLFHQSFYTALFEAVVHNIPADRMRALIPLLSQYYTINWSSFTKGRCKEYG